MLTCEVQAGAPINTHHTPAPQQITTVLSSGGRRWARRA